MNILEKINMLPDPIQFIIYHHYWMLKYNEIICELRKPFVIAENIDFFLRKHIKSIVEKHNLYYYKKFDNQIIQTIQDKGKLLLCKLHKLNIYFSYENCYLKDKNIKEGYKYISPLLLVYSDDYRYVTYNKIKNYV